MTTSDDKATLVGNCYIYDSHTHSSISAGTAPSIACWRSRRPRSVFASTPHTAAVSAARCERRGAATAEEHPTIGVNARLATRGGGGAARGVEGRAGGHGSTGVRRDGRRRSQRRVHSSSRWLAPGAGSPAGGAGSPAPGAGRQLTADYTGANSSSVHRLCRPVHRWRGRRHAAGKLFRQRADAADADDASSAVADGRRATGRDGRPGSRSC